jgi:hypothetical protein
VSATAAGGRAVGDARVDDLEVHVRPSGVCRAELVDLRLEGKLCRPASEHRFSRYDALPAAHLHAVDVEDLDLPGGVGVRSDDDEVVGVLAVQDVGARISTAGSTTMSAADRDPVPRSRVSTVMGATAVGSGSSWRAPSWLDSWNPMRSTIREGCDSTRPPTVANGVQSCSVTWRTRIAVVVVGGTVVVGATVVGAITEVEGAAAAVVDVSLRSAAD